MFTQIVRLTDLSPQTAASEGLARALAQALGARITLLHALEGRPPERAQAALDEEARRLAELGFAARVQLEEGALDDALHDLAGQPALVVVGRTGNSGLDRLLLGSTTRRVLRESPVPVLVAGQRPFTALRRVLCPVDLRPDAPQAIAEAAGLAQATGAGLTLVHTLAPDTALAPDAALAELQRRAAQSLDPAVAAHLRVRFEVGFAEVEAEALAALAEHTDLLVLASHNRRGLAHLLWGSVAEALIERASSPVLVVHPL